MDPVLALVGPLLDIAKIPLGWIGAEMGRADTKTAFNYGIIADLSEKEKMLYQMAMQEKQARAKAQQQQIVIIAIVVIGLVFIFKSSK